MKIKLNHQIVIFNHYILLFAFINFFGEDILTVISKKVKKDKNINFNFFHY